MTTRQRSRTSSRGRGRGFRSGRKTQWVDSLFDFTIANAGQDVRSLLSTLIGNDTQGMTLVRTIIELSLGPINWTGAFGTQALDMGIGMSAQEAFLAGTLPDPSTSTEFPQNGWVIRTRKGCLNPGSVSAGYELQKIQMDLRSQRRIDDGELYMIMDNFPGLGTAFSIQVTGIVRCLFKLP